MIHVLFLSWFCLFDEFFDHFILLFYFTSHDRIDTASEAIRRERVGCIEAMKSGSSLMFALLVRRSAEEEGGRVEENERGLRSPE